MEILVLLAIGLLTGLTTVLFGFGGGFVTVPVVVWADAGLGGDAMRVAVATSALVMVVNAGIATAATRRGLLASLRGSGVLLVLLALGGAVGALAAHAAPSGLARWAFVAYLLVTIVDLLARPGFLRPASTGPDRPAGAGPARPPGRPIPAAFGVPIGALATFLGVGGSVMTVPVLRRSGFTMHAATALANPLTLVIAFPAACASLLAAPPPDPGTAGPGTAGLVGLIDPLAAGALLAGALPVIVALRRRPPRIPDHLYAWSYLALLILVTAAMLLPPTTKLGEASGGPGVSPGAGRA